MTSFVYGVGLEPSHLLLQASAGIPGLPSFHHKTGVASVLPPCSSCCLGSLRMGFCVQVVGYRASGARSIGHGCWSRTSINVETWSRIPCWISFLACIAINLITRTARAVSSIDETQRSGKSCRGRTLVLGSSRRAMPKTPSELLGSIMTFRQVCAVRSTCTKSQLHDPAFFFLMMN